MNPSESRRYRFVRPLPRQLGLAALVAAFAGIVGCTSPGMKLSVKPSSGSSEPQPKVHLQSISPELLKTLLRENSEASIPLERIGGKSQPYQLGPQDVLVVTVWDLPEISLPLGNYRSDAATGFVIDDNGEIFFPYVGTIKVSGLSISAVRMILTQKLASFIRNPQVDAKVISFRSKKVYVGGEVRAPFVTNISDVPLTLAEAIHHAGGLLPAADDSRILLSRGSKTWTVDYMNAVATGNGLGQIILQDGDTVYVPNLQDEPVYMLGEVNRPGLTSRPHGRISLARALAEVGGISGSTADARSIYVLRQARAANEVDVFHLDARNPAAMVLADRFPLQARDVVYVDAGTLVRFSRVMNYILPTVSTANGTGLTVVDYRYLRPR